MQSLEKSCIIISKGENVKIGLIFFIAVVALLIYLSIRTNPMRVQFKNDTLRIYTKECSRSWPVKVLQKENDMVDLLQIERYLVELPNGQKIYVELDDLPPKYALDRDYREIVEKIFGQKFKERFSQDGVVIYHGDFDVALFYKTIHELVMLYPLDETLVDVLIACAKGEEKELPSHFKELPLIKSRWKPEFFILNGFINKNI